MTTAPQAEIAAVPASAPETPAATPSPAVAVETPATTPPSTEPVDDVDALLFGGAPTESPKPGTAPVATPAPTEAAPVSAPVAETPAGTTPPVVEAPAARETVPETPPAEKILPNRISTKQFPDHVQRAMSLFHTEEGKALGFDACLASCKEAATVEQADAAQAAAAAAQEAVNAPNPIADLDGEIAAIQTRIDQIGEEGSIVTPEFTKLTRDLADKLTDRKIAALRQEQQQTANQAVVENRFTASRQQAVEEFPDAAVGDSLLGAMVTAEISARQDPKHPKHASLSQSDAPLQVTRDVAENAAAQIAKVTGISKEQALQSLRGKAPATAPVPPPPAAPATVATPTAPAASQPAAGNVTTAPGNAAITAPPAAPTMASILKQTLPGSKIDVDKYLFAD